MAKAKKKKEDIDLNQLSPDMSSSELSAAAEAFLAKAKAIKGKNTKKKIKISS